MSADIGQRDNIAQANQGKVTELNALLESIHGDTPPSGHSPSDVRSL
jgi:hypothetical protein